MAGFYKSTDPLEELAYSQLHGAHKSSKGILATSAAPSWKGEWEVCQSKLPSADWGGGSVSSLAVNPWSWWFGGSDYHTWEGSRGTYPHFCHTLLSSPLGFLTCYWLCLEVA